MWQHKQEERELKRVEGDIIKNQRAVRRTIREFESGQFYFPYWICPCIYTDKQYSYLRVND